MKKTLISIIVILVVLAALLFFTSSFPFNKDSNSAAPVKADLEGINAGAREQTFLATATREQLVEALRCMMADRTKTLDTCIAQLFGSAVKSVVTISNASNQVRSMNHQIKSVDGAKNVTLMNFAVKSELGPSTIKTVVASASGTIPSTLMLYDGNTMLASAAATVGDITFNNLSIALAKDQTKVLTIRADYPVNVSSGAVAHAIVSGGTFARSAGGVVAMTGYATGNFHRLYTAGTNFALNSATILARVNQNASSTVDATFTLATSPFGGSMTMPVNSDFKVDFTGPSTVSAQSISVVTIPNNNIAEGSTATVTVTAQLPRTAASGLYNANIQNIKWKVGTNTVTQYWGLEDFKTTTGANFVK